jgi:hypothetical protein
MAKKRPLAPERYPSPEELPQLIARRRQLAEQIMLGIVLQAEDQRAADRLLDEILRTYGRAEVTRMEKKLGQAYAKNSRTLYNQLIDRQPTAITHARPPPAGAVRSMAPREA